MKFLVVDVLGAKFWFILLAGAFWITYISWRVYKEQSVLTAWGLGITGYKQTTKVLAIPALVVILGSIWYGLSKGVLVFNWHIIPVIILYPFWGTIQQLIIISLFGGNIYDLENSGLSKQAIVGITAVLFSLVHYPSVPLMAATFLLAICYCLIFLRFRNIIVLGLFHGWLACAFYFFVLGRDPWLEFIGTI
jgi:hypothetical protein